MPKQAAGARNRGGIHKGKVNKKMYLIKAGEIEKKNSNPLEQKAQSHDFEQAKRKANKLLKSFAQVEIIDSGTDQCVHFLTNERLCLEV